MDPLDPIAHTWRVLLSLPGRVGIVAPVTPQDLQRMSTVTFGLAGPRVSRPA